MEQAKEMKKIESLSEHQQEGRLCVLGSNISVHHLSASNL